MQDVERVSTILNELKAMGVLLSMDDFGTGYSSLSYLKRFPFDILKIDQSFVRDITSDPDSAAIAKTVIAMAHSLHLKVVAEGVEKEGQLNYLRSHGCDEMQGYYFSRPIAAPEFELLLRERHQLQPAVAQEPAPHKTVLVVDDEELVVASLQELLMQENYHVLTAGSAAEGFDLLAGNRVAVVIADLRMPVMGGTEFLGRVRELYPDVVRIIISGQADLDAVTDAINHGFVYRFINKPWQGNAMQEHVADAFRYHAAQAGK
jgi:CheY-like chemotaxis protein